MRIWSLRAALSRNLRNAPLKDADSQLTHCVCSSDLNSGPQAPLDRFVSKLAGATSVSPPGDAFQPWLINSRGSDRFQQFPVFSHVSPLGPPGQGCGTAAGLPGAGGCAGEGRRLVVFRRGGGPLRPTLLQHERVPSHLLKQPLQSPDPGSDWPPARHNWPPVRWFPCCSFIGLRWVFFATFLIIRVFY